MEDVKFRLRRLDLLSATEECLRKAGELYGKSASSGKSSSRSSRDLQAYFDEFVFACVDRRGLSLGHHRLSALEEFHLIYTLSRFWMKDELFGKYDAKTRYAIFDAVFFGRNGDSKLHNVRVDILVKTCALAVQLPSVNFLQDVIICIQKVGIQTSSSRPEVPFPRQVVAKLLEDFCSPLQDLHENLLGMVFDWTEDQSSDTCAPLALLIMVIRMPLSEPFVCPDLPVVKVFTHWVVSNPKGLLRTVKSASSWSGLMKAFTSTIERLFALTITQPISPTVDLPSDDAQLFAKLHAGMLQLILMAIGQIEREPTLFHVLTLQRAMQRLIEYKRDKMEGSTEVGQVAKNFALALDRLAQVLQLCSGMNCLQGGLYDLKRLYDILSSEHPLLSHILNQY